MHTRAHTHLQNSIYQNKTLQRTIYIYQLCNNYRQSLFPFLLSRRHKCLVLSHGRLEKPRVPRKETGPHTHRTNIDRGPEARWWKWGSDGALKGVRGVISRLIGKKYTSILSIFSWIILEPI